MKKQLTLLTAALVSLAAACAFAQPGMRGPMGGPPGPRLGGDMAKIFGENSAFSANLEMRMSGGPNGEFSMPGKISYLEGTSRFEMNMSQAKGGGMSPQMADQMKQMGMDQMTSISRPDKKITYLIYTGMHAYVENPIQDPEQVKPESDFKVDVTELGKDKVDGHDCVKNKVVVTDKEGKSHESTVWNATDLKKFPVKIETAEGGNSTVMLFTDVKLGKPDTAQFDPPSDFKKYDSMMEMMRGEMMKRMGGAGMPTPPGN